MFEEEHITDSQAEPSRPASLRALELAPESGPTISTLLLEPFRRVCASLPVERRPVLEALSGRQASRVSADQALTRLARAVRQTADPDLGIAAGQRVSAGMFGLLDYAMLASDTLRHAILTARSHSRLISDTWFPALEPHGDDTLLRVGSADPLQPRAAGDFGVSAFYTNHLKVQLEPGALREVWLAHPKPAETRAYEALFAQIPLRFDAPAYGFLLSTAAVDAPLPGCNPVVHAMLCARAKLVREYERIPRSFTGRVRETILNALAQNDTPTMVRTSGELRISRRTLVRRLGEEATTFARERDFIRCELAEDYLLRDQLGLTEVSMLLGFSYVQAFHRAFRRWTGETPASYRLRRSQR